MVLMQVLHSFSITFVSGIQSTLLEILVMDEGRGNLGYTMRIVEKVNKIFFYLHNDNFQSLQFVFISSNRNKRLKFVCLEGLDLKNAEKRKLSKTVNSTNPLQYFAVTSRIEHY